MKILFILASVMVVLFVAAPNKVEAQKPKGGRDTSSIGKFQAVVGNDEATFVFPIRPQKRYEWYGGGVQYAWEVRLKNKNRNYEVGFSLTTPLSGGFAASGDFQVLLNSGQFSAWRVVRKTAEVIIEVIEEVSVEGFSSEKHDRLTIKVTGSKAVQLLFSGKPKSVIFFTKILNKSTSVIVPVTYTGK